MRDCFCDHFHNRRIDRKIHRAGGNAPLLVNLINDKTDSTSSIDTWYGFLIHNGTADFAIMAMGLIPFIPLSALAMAYNGVLLGFFTSVGSILTSHSLFESFLYGVAPHGILEYAVNCLTFALGIYLWKTVTNRVLKKDSDNLKTAILNCLRVFILFVLPGLLIAGIIEANITPLIINRIGM